MDNPSTFLLRNRWMRPGSPPVGFNRLSIASEGVLTPRVGSPAWLIVFLVFGLHPLAFSQQVEFDMDRNTPGIQAHTNNLEFVEGALVVTGCNDAGRYAVQMIFTNTFGGNTIVCNGSSTMAGPNEPGYVQDGAIGIAFPCNDRSVPNTLTRANLFSANATAVEGQVTLFFFNLELNCEGDSVTVTLQTSDINSTLGVNVNGEARTFGPDSSNPIPTVGGSIQCGYVDRIGCVDSGYSILDGFGGRHQVGMGPLINGPVYFGTDIATDVEHSGSVFGATDILVLDRFGGVSFVANAGETPASSFAFPDGTSPAVDVEIANDNAGFWVLRADGGIYATGSALAGGSDGSLPVAQTPVALDFPFGGAVPRNTNPRTPAIDPDANVRAVGFVVVQSDDPLAPIGIVVLDSQGGHYILSGSGADEMDDDVTNSILNAPGGSGETVYPFWQGLDIGRDIELHPNGLATDGVGIYDGFGGVHPVPVNDSASGVQFLRNEGFPRSAVGLPYLTIGFDDPTTAEDESDTTTFGIDSQSIFRDLEFCQRLGFVLRKGFPRGGEGVYVLDAFGGVFTLGNTRRLGFDNPSPSFTGGPYFFPNPLARDLEPSYILQR